MNIRAPQQPRATQAAEGLPRRAFSVAEVERMVKLGLIGDDERVELIGGELVPMAAKGIRHEAVASALARSWQRLLPADVWLMADATLRVSDDTYLEPDFVIVPREAVGRARDCADALLVVEVADSSIGFDLGPKALLYAKLGARELWVIDAVRMITHVHRGPNDGAYREIVAVPASSTIVPLLVPNLSMALSGLEMP